MSGASTSDLTPRKVTVAQPPPSGVVAEADDFEPEGAPTDSPVPKGTKGVHVIGNTLADGAAKSAIAMASVAAVTCSEMRLDNDILTAVKASAEGKFLPKAYLTKYSYHSSAQNVAYATIPGVGD
ncbi:hypothetical protein NDU88_007243 [Pleurodeles waltl]|uniref:Uncharacterized protein n=1 Tax=Pleurodeles waltl TaxID=8319 RepID=A0AAV7PKP5_PLEWA|nr:hypothetical protein NDU88_007243 [Pleurodeles waltl]